jgi:hypothetical protein
MADTAAVLLIRPQLGASVGVSRSTAAVLFVPWRGVSGLFSSSGITSATAKNLKSWKPSALAPVVDDKGCITPAWNKFIDYLIETVLGGASAPTLPQVQRSIGYSEAQSLIVNAVAAALQQQVQSNAQSLAAAVEVLKSNTLTGAVQIPTVQLQPIDVTPPPDRGGGGE